MKKLIAIALALITALTLVSCKKAATGDLGDITKNKKLIIGITDYEPMNYYDETGKLVGFDTEFAEALCKKLGVTPEFVVINWETKEIELKAKNIDVIWNGLTVTEERRENMAFSDTYLKNRQVVVVRAADAASYPDKNSFAGATVVAEAESAGQTAVLADLTGASFIAVEAQTTALLEVGAGTAAAAVIDYTMARAMTGAGTDYSDLVILDIPLTDELYAIGLRLDSTAVVRFNEIIKELTTDGTLKTLADKYELTDLLV
jgi:polar amino acid transport system substrate-binding protein